MANSDKNILITPNVGQTSEPTIKFTGANNTPITMRVLDPGTLSFEGASGQLFSIADGLTGSVFSVNDVSGIPSIEVMDTGLVKLAQYNGSVTVGTGTALRAESGSVDAELSVLASTATTPGLIVRGATSQTAHLQQWQNSAGTMLARVDQNGNILAQNLSIQQTIFSNSMYDASTATTELLVSGGFRVRTSNTSNIAFRIQRTDTAETADSMQILSSGGTVFAGYNSRGQSWTGSTSPILVATGGATTAASGTGTVATITTTSAHGLATGDLVVIAGITPTGYNGTYLVTGTPSTTQFTYANTTTGAQTVAGTVSTPSQSSITARSAGTTLLSFTTTTYPHQSPIIRARSSDNVSLFTIFGNGQIDTSAGLSAPSIYNRTSTANSMITLASSGTQITTSVASNIALTIQNTNASPTGNLTEWKSTGGSIWASVDSSARFVIGGSSQSPLGTLTVVAASANQVATVVRGAASQTSDLQQWQNSGGTSVATMNPSGIFTAYRLIGTDDIYMTSSGTLSIGISNSNSGTGGMLRIRRSTGSPGFAASADGLGLFVNSGTDANTYAWKTQNPNQDTFTLFDNISNTSTNTIAITTPNARFYNNVASTIPVIIKGATSQTASLQEWQDSAGTTLAKINSSGDLTAINGTFTGPVILDNASVDTPLVVKAGLSSNYIQEWKDEFNNLVAYVSTLGEITTTGVTIASTSLLATPLIISNSNGVPTLTQWFSSLGPILKVTSDGTIVSDAGSVSSAPALDIYPSAFNNSIQVRSPYDSESIAFSISGEGSMVAANFPIDSVRTFVGSTQPASPEIDYLAKYLWWDTSGGNLTLWIEDGGF